MANAQIRWKEFLEWMEAPHYHNVYVLGSFARRVTVYSQQVRALNLIDALCKTGKLYPNSNLAVIGGGAAGLTAAAAAAVRGINVKLLEKRQEVMTIQSDALHRWLHPHIYDWPNDQKGDSAQLPILNWKADRATEVVRQFRSQWKELLSLRGDIVQERCDAENIDIRRDGNQVALSWNDKEGQNSLPFDIVILAVGFGVEPPEPGKSSYWVKDELDGQIYDGQIHNERRYLVSGYGDGGFTDLMRLCIREFMHENIIDLFANASDIDNIRSKLLSIENDPQAQNRSFLTVKYSNLRVDSLVQELNSKRRNNKIWLNGESPYPYGLESSILNRFIVSQLAKTAKPFILIVGKITNITPLQKGGYEVKFDNNRMERFDDVVCRHGPESVLKTEDTEIENAGGNVEFLEIGKACKELRRKWKELPPSKDWTRQPMWAPGAFRSGETDAFATQSILDLGESEVEKVECIILVSGNTQDTDNLRYFVEHALRQEQTDIENVAEKPLNLSPTVIDVSRALKNVDLYNETVRKLCVADIAVLDISKIKDGSEPGMMLFLGIRSVVRRGVTVTVVSERLDDAVWSGMPFNLKELYPVSYGGNLKHNDPEHPINRISSMIKEGLKLLRNLPEHYLDLPAFDAVRRLGPTPENYRPIPKEEQILVLCSFNPDYTNSNWNKYLALEVKTAFEKKIEAESGTKAKFNLARITDIVSPRLVSHRLYAEIRRSDVCLIDWTEWRANVFYEMGVRLAVNPISPICVISRDGLNKSGQREDMFRLFAPITYSPGQPSSESEEFRKAMVSRYDEVKFSPASENRKSELAHDHTFNLVFNTVYSKQEPGGVEVHHELITAAYAMINEDTQAAGVWPILYWKNSRLTSQARRGAINRLLAAWFYLQERHKAAKLPPHDPIWKEYIRLGKKLKPLLLDTGIEQDEDLGRAIGKKVSALEKRAKKNNKQKDV